MSKKKALVVGINVYRTSGNNLPSCVNDSNKFSDLLRVSYGFSDSNILKLQDIKATLANIQEGLKWLFQDAKPDDNLVFYYSGHGYRTEKDGVLKECLVPSDEQFFFDDELSPYTQSLPPGNLSLVLDSPDRQSLPPGILSLVLDSCYSGGMEKAFFIAKAGEERIRIKTWFPPPEELSKTLAAEANSNLDYQPFDQSVIRSNLSFTELAVSSSLNSLTSQPNGNQVNGLLISACKANEKAIASTPETQGLSAFTFGLLQSISSLGTKISNKTLLNAARQKVQDIGLTQTPLLIEPLEPQGLGDLSFITFEPADKSIVIPSKPEAPSRPQDGTASTPITLVTKTFAVSLDKKELYHKLTEGISYPEAIGYSIKTLKELLSDLQPVNYQWLTYNYGEIGSWNADIKGQQWGTTLCQILPDGDRAYPTIVEELSKAIQVAQEADILINPYTPEAVERLMLKLSQAMSASAKISSMLRDISAPPTPD
jgi:hypothetical protein